MSLKIWLNGELVPEEQATVSVFDHGLLYGDGVFEGIRAYGGRVFRLDRHIERLERSARAILLDIPLTHDEMCRATVETCRANELVDGYVRLVVTRGVGDLGLDPRKCSRPTVFIIAAGIQLYPEELYETGLTLITCSTRRNSANCLDPGVKSLNYLNNILARIECNHAGVAEGIMLTSEGMVSECTADNIFYVDGGVLNTPPTEAGILNGITRQTVLEIAGDLGIERRERMFPITDIYAAEEAFLSGTAAELVPVVDVDGRTIGDGKPGPVTRRLLEGFRLLTKAEGTPIYE